MDKSLKHWLLALVALELDHYIPHHCYCISDNDPVSAGRQTMTTTMGQLVTTLMWLPGENCNQDR